MGGGVVGRHCKGDIAIGDNAPCNGNIPVGDIMLVAGRHDRGGGETVVQDSVARQQCKTAAHTAAQESSALGAGRVEENGVRGEG